MKGKKWYNLSKVSLTQFAFPLTLILLIMIMWIQTWSVISGQNTANAGRKLSMTTSITNLKIKRD